MTRRNGPERARARAIAACVGLALAAGLAGAADAGAETEAVMAVPEVRSWVAPIYPPAALERKRDGRVQVRLVIDALGAVTTARAVHATDPAFAEAAVRSVLQWRFKPAEEDGHPVAKCMDVVLPFRWADEKRGPLPGYPPAEVLLSLAWSPRTGPAKIAGDDPDYPDTLLARHLKGVVAVKFDLGADGSMRGVKVFWATHPDFIRPALAAAERWRFRPAMQGDLAVPAPMETALEFDVLEPKPVDMLAANGITLVDPPAGLDARPGIGMLVDPVYPYDQLLAGTEGDATVDFVIGADGIPGAVAVRAATQPEFGRAFAAAVDSWYFKPARKDGAAVPVRAEARWHFGPGTEAGRAVARLVARMRAHDTADMGARGLDGRLNPRYQIAPVYPGALRPGKAAGQAQVSFVIDREGRCRLARVVSASREEFGWAAATAVERWVFEPPRRGGRPTDVRVEIPFDFAAP